MILEPHDLHSEFPEYHGRILALKASDAHFASLFAQYHEVNRHVQNIELNTELATEQELEILKKQRLHLKDELYAILSAAPAA